jgi:hypothetical protein
LQKRQALEAVSKPGKGLKATGEIYAISIRTAGFGEPVIRRMTRVALERGAINLYGQESPALQLEPIPRKPQYISPPYPHRPPSGILSRRHYFVKNAKK